MQRLIHVERTVDNIGRARKSAVELSSALTLTQESLGKREVLTISSTEGHGVPDSWTIATSLIEQRQSSGKFATRRQNQDQRWFEEIIKRKIAQRIKSELKLEQAKKSLLQLIQAGSIDPLTASELYVAAIFRHPFDAS